MNKFWLAPMAAGTFFLSAHPIYAQTLVEFIPQRAAMAVAVDDPCGLLDTIESLPLDRLRDQVPAVRAAMMSPQLFAGRGGLMWAEGQLGADYREILRVAAGNGIVLGVENEKSLVLITKSPQPERLEGLLRAVVQLASGMKIGKNAPMPEPTGNYRDIDAYKIGELVIATVGEYVILSTHGELAKATIDRLLDGGDKKLWKGLPTGNPTSVRVLVRHEALPNIETLVANAIGPNRDFGQELLFGGVLSAMDAAGASWAVFDLTNSQLTAEWQMLHRPARLADIETFDPETGEALNSNEEAEETTLDKGRLSSIRSAINGFDDRLLEFHVDFSKLTLPSLTNDAIAEITVDRDLATLWAEKDILLTENVAAQLDVADSQLSTAFGGFDFGDEVLGAVNPTLRVVVFPPASPNSNPPVLPEAAVIASLRSANPQAVARRFRIAWQTVIGIVNVERGGNGQPQLELETLKEGDLQMMTGRYSIEDARELNAASVDLYSNLAPSIATAGNRIVIATSDTLAKGLISDDQLQPQSADGGILTVAVGADRLGNLLRMNRPALLAQNMLERGHSKQQAESDIDTLIGAVEFFDDAALRMLVHPRGLRGIAKLAWGSAKKIE